MVLVFPSPARRKRDLGAAATSGDRCKIDRARKTGRVAQTGLDLGYRSKWRRFDVPVMRPLDTSARHVRLARRSLALRPAHSRSHQIRDPLSEGIRLVSSMPAPVASGWSESPGRACIHWKEPPFTAHTHCGPWSSANERGTIQNQSADRRPVVTRLRCQRSFTRRAFRRAGAPSAQGRLRRPA